MRSRSRFLSTILTLFVASALIVVTSNRLDASDEIEFTRALAQIGEFDLARYQTKKIENSNRVSRETKQYVPVLRAFILSTEAEQTAQGKERAKLFKKARKKLKNFIQKHENHPNRLEARFDLAENFRKSAKAWSGVHEEATGEKKNTAFERANKYFQEALAIYRQIGKEHGGKEGSDSRVAVLKSRYFVPVTRYERTTILKQAGNWTEVKNVLQEVLSNIEDFQWDHGRTTASKRLTLYSAMANYRLSQYYSNQNRSKKAEKYDGNATSAFESVIGFADDLQQASPSERQLLTGLVLRGYYFWARILNDNSEYEEAINVTGKAMSEENIPDPLDHSAGKAMYLERAKAFFSVRSKRKAIELANQVARRGGYWGNEAKRMVANWSKMIGGEISPETWLNMVDGARGNDNFNKSINLARKGLGQLEGEDEWNQWGWKFFERIALGYTDQERWYEAAVAYNEIHNEFKDLVLKEEAADVLSEEEKESLKELIPKSKFYTARCYARARENTGSEKDDKAFQKHLDYLRKNYPDSKFAPRTNLMLGDVKRNAGQYKEAINRYKDTKKQSSVYERSLVRVAYTYFLWGKSLADSPPDKEEKSDGSAKEKFTKAVEESKNYLKYTENNTPRDQSQRQSNIWTARDIIALSYLREEIKKYDEVISMLSKMVEKEKKWGDNIRAKAISHMVDAYVKKGNVKKAKELAGRLQSEFPAQKATWTALNDLAGDFYSRKDQFKGKDRKKYSQAWKNALLYAYRRLKLKIKHDVTTREYIYRVAANMLEYVRQFGGEDMAMKAKELLEGLRNNSFDGQRKNFPSGEQPPTSREIKASLADVYTQIGDFEKASVMYDELIQAYNEEQGEDAPLPGYLLLKKARLHRKLFNNASNNQEADKHFKKAYQILADLAGRLPDGSETWWDIRYLLVKLDIEHGDYQDAKSSLELLKERGEDKPYDGDERFPPLMEEVKENIVD